MTRTIEDVEAELAEVTSKEYELKAELERRRKEAEEKEELERKEKRYLYFLQLKEEFEPTEN